MAKANTLKAQIDAALAAGTAKLYDDGKAVLFESVLYSVRKGSSPYARMKSQRQNRRRLGIVLPAPAPKATPATDAAPTVRRIIAPVPGHSRKAWARDFAAHVARQRAKGLIPAPVN